MLSLRIGKTQDMTWGVTIWWVIKNDEVGGQGTKLSHCYPISCVPSSHWVCLPFAIFCFLPTSAVCYLPFAVFHLYLPFSANICHFLFAVFHLLFSVCYFLFSAIFCHLLPTSANICHLPSALFHLLPFSIYCHFLFSANICHLPSALLLRAGMGPRAYQDSICLVRTQLQLMCCTTRHLLSSNFGQGTGKGSEVQTRSSMSISDWGTYMRFGTYMYQREHIRVTRIGHMSGSGFGDWK